jgi:hypothetical protein
MESQIKDIFNKNKINDLTYFLAKRRCLNKTNMYIAYLYHTVQATGILLTSLATGYSKPELAWVGIGLNIFAQLLNSVEHINVSLSDQLKQNIVSIQQNNYIDENTLHINTDNSETKTPGNTNTTQVQSPV